MNIPLCHFVIRAKDKDDNTNERNKLSCLSESHIYMFMYCMYMDMYVCIYTHTCYKPLLI